MRFLKNHRVYLIILIIGIFNAKSSFGQIDFPEHEIANMVLRLDTIHKLIVFELDTSERMNTHVDKYIGETLEYEMIIKGNKFRKVDIDTRNIHKYLENRHIKKKSFDYSNQDKIDNIPLNSQYNTLADSLGTLLSQINFSTDSTNYYTTETLVLSLANSSHGKLYNKKKIDLTYKHVILNRVLEFDNYYFAIYYLSALDCDFPKVPEVEIIFKK